MTWYHATLKINEPSIRQRGLIPGGDCQLFDWCDNSHVYLMDDPSIAKSFVSLGVVEVDDEDREAELEAMFEEGGLLLTIQLPEDREALLQKDGGWNADEGASVVYPGTIKPEWIIKYEDFEPF